MYAGPVEWAANIQLGVACSNLLMVETIETEFHRDLIGGTIAVEGGFVSAPEAPGLGIEFNEDLASAHPYTGDGLHLQMQDEPCDWQNGNAFVGGSPE